MNAIEIEGKLKEKVDLYLSKEIKAYARWSNWAGDLGLDCDTYQALCRLKPELKPLSTLEKIKIFRTGNISETPNLQLMQNAGIKILEQARPYQWKEKQISGRIDAKIEIQNEKKLIIPLEHKACSPNVFRTILKHKQEGTSLTKSRYPWVRKYPGQLQVYELMDGSEYGVWFFYNKVSGDYFFWFLQIDFEYTETLIKRAERCNENVDKNFIPPPEQKEICDGCDFASTFCFSGKTYGPGFEFISDPEIETKVDKYFELEDAEKERKEIHEELKDTFEKRHVIIGSKYKIDGKEIERKEYIVAAGNYWKIKIERL